MIFMLVSVWKSENCWQILTSTAKDVRMAFGMKQNIPYIPVYSDEQKPGIKHDF